LGPLSDPLEKEKVAFAASEVLKTTVKVNTCVPGIKINVPGYRKTDDSAPTTAAVVIVTPHGFTAFPIVPALPFAYCILDWNRPKLPLAVLALFPQKSSYPDRVLKSKVVDEPEEAWQLPSAPRDIVPLHPANKFVIVAAVAGESEAPGPFALRNPVISLVI
jgi:hypothetical protein